MKSITKNADMGIISNLRNDIKQKVLSNKNYVILVQGTEEYWVKQSDVIKNSRFLIKSNQRGVYSY